MNPAQFREVVLPDLLAAWKQQCFCASPGFRKVVSFNFQDYEMRPVGLADAEVLIDEIIRQNFIATDDFSEEQDGMRAGFRCPQCDAKCMIWLREFSISMYTSLAEFEGKGEIAARGKYLIGFYGFKGADFSKVTDYLATESIDEFKRHVVSG